MLRLAALAVAAAIAIYGFGRWHGSAACDARHEAAQAKHELKVRKEYERIDRQIPFSGDDAAVADFLLRHTRQ